MRCYMIMLCFIFPIIATAGNWQNIWLRPDQQGARLLTAGKAQQAASRFDNQQWKADALYQSGQYEQAAKLYATLSDKEDYYNQGNAWAKSHQYQQAIAAYKQALSIDPQMTDAKHNLAIVEALLKQKNKKTHQSSQQQKEAKNKQQQNQQKNQQQASDRQFNPASSENQPSSAANQQQAQQKERSQKKSPSSNTNASHRQVLTNKPRRQSSASKDDTPQTQKKQTPPDNHDNTQSQLKQLNQQDNTHATLPEKQSNDQSLPRAQLIEQQQVENAKVKKWLEQIPDDPGGLLRRKFLRDYQREQSHDY